MIEIILRVEGGKMEYVRSTCAGDTKGWCTYPPMGIDWCRPHPLQGSASILILMDPMRSGGVSVWRHYT